MSDPTMRRFYRKECTRCGRKLTGPETLWCRRCSKASRLRGGRTPRIFTPEEWQAYIDALFEAYPD